MSSTQKMYVKMFFESARYGVESLACDDGIPHMSYV